MQTEPALRYTVYDPFAEALYCRQTFNEAAQVADGLGCSLIIAVAANSIFGEAVQRYRKSGQRWQIEQPKLRKINI